MEHLKPADRALLRERLLAERQRLLEGGPVVDAVDVDPGDRQDLAATEAANRTRAMLGRSERLRLREVEAALHRMEIGTYGICEETGEEIPLARLLAEPTSRHTVEALEMLEEERARERSLEHDDESDPY